MYVFARPLSKPGGLTARQSGCYDDPAGWSSLVARWAHNPKVGGSNPPPATKELTQNRREKGAAIKAPFIFSR